MKNVPRIPRLVGQVALAAVGAAGLIAAVRAPFAVKGVTYRVKVETRMPNFAFGGGGAGGATSVAAVAEAVVVVVVVGRWIPWRRGHWTAGSRRARR